jgi:hypothetical protein
VSNEELLGLLIGLGVLAAVIGNLADVWVHPGKYWWLDLKRSNATRTKPEGRSKL